VLGFVGCRVTSKLCWIGPAERSWGRVKNIKTGKRSHMSGESTEKRSILYVSAKYSSQESCVIGWRSWMQRGIMQCLMMISILICSLSDLMWTRGL